MIVTTYLRNRAVQSMAQHGTSCSAGSRALTVRGTPREGCGLSGPMYSVKISPTVGAFDCQVYCPVGIVIPRITQPCGLLRIIACCQQRHSLSVMVDGGTILNLCVQHSSICTCRSSIHTRVMPMQLPYGVRLGYSTAVLAVTTRKCGLCALQSCTPAAPAGCLLSVRLWCPCGS